MHHQNATREMRARSVSYLERNWKEYENLILSEAVAINPGAWPDDDMKEAVIKKRIEELKKPGTWGGSDIIRAISDMLRIRINVYVRNREVWNFGSAGSVVLNLFYNGSSHYDSISGIEQLEAPHSTTGGPDNDLRDQQVTLQPPSGCMA